MNSQNLQKFSDVKIKVSPSILSADFAKLGEDINSVNSAEYLHFDIMDGVFVPNISGGLSELESVRKFTDMSLDVHLMIVSPLKYVARFADAGADIVTFHLEAEPHENILAAIEQIHKLGKKAGLSIKPNTSYEALLPYIDMLDLILVMTVEPGFGGQKFIADMLPKISKIRDIITSHGLATELEVDGGINPETAKLCIEAGANVLVAGSDIFGASDRGARIAELKVR
jgi:ribulose-phosphate 3-epimerase